MVLPSLEKAFTDHSIAEKSTIQLVCEARQTVATKLRPTSFEQTLAHPIHQGEVEVQVVDCVQTRGGDLATEKQMAQIGLAEVLAGVTRALRI